MAGRTCDDLGALEVLVGVQVAGRQGKVDAHENQQEVASPPHGGSRRDAALTGVEGPRRRIVVVQGCGMLSRKHGAVASAGRRHRWLCHAEGGPGRIDKKRRQGAIYSISVYVIRIVYVLGDTILAAFVRRQSMAASDWSTSTCRIRRVGDSESSVHVTQVHAQG